MSLILQVTGIVLKSNFTSQIINSLMLVRLLALLSLSSSLGGLKSTKGFWYNARGNRQEVDQPEKTLRERKFNGEFGQYSSQASIETTFKKFYAQKSLYPKMSNIAHRVD